MLFGDVELKWFGHDSFVIKNSKKVIYIDPYNLSNNLEKADFILITHSHYDHCSIADINKIVKDGTIFLVTPDAQSKITKINARIKMEIVSPNQEFNFQDIRISTIPAYNTDKHFHSVDESWVGYLIKIGDVLIYHAGDTDLIPEMQKLTGYGNMMFIALLPIGGRYTMTAEEAVEAAKLIKPTIAIPMHYGSVVGNENDAKDFLVLCEEAGIKAVILEKS